MIQSHDFSLLTPVALATLLFEKKLTSSRGYLFVEILLRNQPLNNERKKLFWETNHTALSFVKRLLTLACKHETRMRLSETNHVSVVRI